MFRVSRLLRPISLLCLSSVMLLLSAWLAMAWHIQQAFGTANPIIIGLWLIFSLLAIFKLWQQGRKPYAAYVHGLIALLGIVWFLSIPAQQNRLWQADVAKTLHYQRQGSLVTLHNVRNFDWRSQTDYTERWETREYDLNHITGINVIASYWMGPKIAHTLVSFDFKDQAPLVFSIEIRKEENEEFSAIGGFFRQFELSLIAADEKDIVYTRSNVRGEQVYFFPIQGISQDEMQALFLEYLAKSDSLQATPQWYNTLFSNCTTLIYSMAQTATHNDLPLDYRILASGYLPNYLHEVKALNQDWNMKTWYQQAHVNPKTVGKKLDNQEYSDLIRQGLPQAH